MSGHKLCILLILLSKLPAYAQISCGAYLSQAPSLVSLQPDRVQASHQPLNRQDLDMPGALMQLQGEALLTAIEQAMFMAMNPSDNGVDLTPTPSEFKKLKSPSRLMTVLKKTFYHSHASLGFILWTTFEPRIFSSPDLENQAYIKRVEAIFRIYMDEFQSTTIDKLYGTIAKGKAGSFEAKVKVAQKLKQNQIFFSQLLGQPINLFEDSGWLAVFGIDDLSQLSAKMEENTLSNEALHHRIANRLVINETPERQYRLLIEDFFGTSGLGFRNDGRGFLIRNIDRALVEDLIKELRLGSKLEDKYMADLELASQFVSSKAYRVPLSYALIFFKAYLEKHPSIPGFTNLSKVDRYFNPQIFLSLQNTIHRNKIIRAVEDEKFSAYIKLSEALNLKHQELAAKIADLRKRYPKFEVELKRLVDNLAKIPVISDFDSDLTSIEFMLRELESERDTLTEAILDKIALENIHVFQDLNYRWDRILPQKSYQLKGLDYTHVKFTKDVLARFAKNPIDGARFLAALSKSYVPLKGASGLRKLAGLPEDFRDIKLIKAGSKIRIVGRMIEKTIHFFYVYEADRPYDNKAITTIVENYRP